MFLGNRSEVYEDTYASGAIKRGDDEPCHLVFMVDMYDDERFTSTTTLPYIGRYYLQCRCPRCENECFAAKTGEFDGPYCTDEG